MIFKISSEKIEEFIEKQHSIDGMVSMHDFELWLEEQPRVGEWISCSERLPEDTKTKAITFADGSVDAGYYSEEKWWCVGDSVGLEVVKTENVIAWMPLPEQYKAGDQE